jgi:hypothetical protein
MWGHGPFGKEIDYAEQRDTLLAALATVFETLQAGPGSQARSLSGRQRPRQLPDAREHGS